MELKEIIEQLSIFGNDQPLPRAVLAEAVRHKEEVAPVLLDALDALYDKARAEEDESGEDPVFELAAYAVFLLAEMQEQRAYPKLLRLLTLNSDDLEFALGDIVSFIGNSLYSTYNGDLDAAKEILCDSRLDPFARGQVLDLLEGLFRDDRLSKEELSGFLRERLATLGDGENEEIFGGMLASAIASSDLYELAEDVREAFRLEKIDEMHMGKFDSFFDYLYNEDRDVECARLVTDTAEELSGWDCFQSDTLQRPSISEVMSWNVGRNDPCPCGSGKKFKKCCLLRKEEWQLIESRGFSNLEMDWDQYPPIERQGERPGLSEFYSEDAIAVDRLAYRALLVLRRPNFQQRSEPRKTKKEAKELLWAAFEKFRQICAAKNLHMVDEYDQGYKLHYYAKEWLGELRDLLEDEGGDRYDAVRAVLES